MLGAGLNSPLTSSAGRLFDAVASLIGLRQIAHYEGQAAIELEYAAWGHQTNESYAVQLVKPIRAVAVAGGRPSPASPLRAGPGLAKDSNDAPWVVDWAAAIDGVLCDRRAGLPARAISAKFHNTLVEAMVAVARQVGEPKVLLTGGCFQNRYLVERAVQQLRAAGFTPYWHQRIPPNDGGVAVGQILAAAQALGQDAATCV
jgi:hydrogenase maturation protein HypF